MHLKVGGLGAHVGRLVFAVTTLVSLDEALVVLAGNRLEVGRRGNMPFGHIETHGADLGFGGGKAGNRGDAGVEPGFGKGLIEIDGRIADYGGENYVRPGVLDLPYGGAKVAAVGAQIQIRFPGDRATAA